MIHKLYIQHAYDGYVSESQQEKLIRLNESLHHHEPNMTARIWQYEQVVKNRIADATDWINDGHIQTSVVFTWCADAPERLELGSVIAAVIHEHYVDPVQRATWQHYEGWHNDLFGHNVYPVDGRHNIWFHALYDHLYGENRLSWSQISRLGGCYLAFEQAYQCGIDLSLFDAYLIRSDNLLTDEGIAKQIKKAVIHILSCLISNHEQNCRRELIEQDQRCLHEIQDNDHPLFDYDLKLNVWLSDPDNDQDSEPALSFSCKGIAGLSSDDSTQDTKRIKQGFIDLANFLRQELNQRAIVSGNQIYFSSWLYIDIVVMRKEKAIEQFEDFRLERRNRVFNAFVMQIPDTWLPVIDEMFMQIDTYCQRSGIDTPNITQIKEKVRSLRVYWDRKALLDSIHEKVIDDIIQSALQKCEIIGL